MNKLMKRIGALALSTVVWMGAAITTCAKDDNYTYN